MQLVYLVLKPQPMPVVLSINQGATKAAHAQHFMHKLPMEKNLVFSSSFLKMFPGFLLIWVECKSSMQATSQVFQPLLN